MASRAEKQRHTSRLSGTETEVGEQRLFGLKAKQQEDPECQGHCQGVPRGMAINKVGRECRGHCKGGLGLCRGVLNYVEDIAKGILGLRPCNRIRIRMPGPLCRGSKVNAEPQGEMNVADIA